MSRRSDLRAQVWDISGARCEHPTRLSNLVFARCPRPAAELAHIVPRGMGHKGDRDRLDNVMAACTIHARSTDDLSSPEWDGVPGWRRDGERGVWMKRQALARYVLGARGDAGVDVEASDAD